MPVIISAHEDRQIKLWDINSGKCLHAMVAHLDEVTCLACDPNGLYLLSGSKCLCLFAIFCCLQCLAGILCTTSFYMQWTIYFMCFFTRQLARRYVRLSRYCSLNDNKSKLNNGLIHFTLVLNLLVFTFEDSPFQKLRLFQRIKFQSFKPFHKILNVHSFSSSHRSWLFSEVMEFRK